MEQALRLIGYSAHSESPRLGEKAQLARWGLDEDTLPKGYTEEGGCVSAPTRDAQY